MPPRTPPIMGPMWEVEEEEDWVEAGEEIVTPGAMTVVDA